MAAARRWSIPEARRIRQLGEPECPERLIRRFGLICLLGAARFPGYLAALYEITPEPQARLLLLENLLEESGVHVRPWLGVGMFPASRHLEWIERFVRASGASEADIAATKRRAMGGTGSAWFDAAVRAGRWAETMAYTLVGQEANVPPMATAVLAALRARGYADTDLVFFIRHIEADQKHGQDAIDLLAGLPLDPKGRDAVLDAVRRGADDWWALFNGRTPVQGSGRDAG